MTQEEMIGADVTLDGKIEYYMGDDLYAVRIKGKWIFLKETDFKTIRPYKKPPEIDMRKGK